MSTGTKHQATDNENSPGANSSEESDDEAFETYMASVMRSTQEPVASTAPNVLKYSETEVKQKIEVDNISQQDNSLGTKRRSFSDIDSISSNQEADIKPSNLVKMPTSDNLAPDCREFILEIFDEIFNISLAKHHTKYSEPKLAEIVPVKMEDSSSQQQSESGREAVDQNLINRRELFASSKPSVRKAPALKPRKRSKNTAMSKQRQELFSKTPTEESTSQTISKTEEKPKSPSNSTSEPLAKNAIPKSLKKESSDQSTHSKKKSSFFKRLFGGSKKQKQEKPRVEKSNKASISKKPSFSVPVKPPRPPSVRNRKPSDQEMSQNDYKNNNSYKSLQLVLRLISYCQMLK